MKNTFRLQFEQICKKSKDRCAIAYLRENDEIENISYGAIYDHIKMLESKLQRIGVGKADRVAIITPHSPHGVIAGVALAYIGCTAVMIDASLPSVEIRRLLEEGDVVAVFADVNVENQLGWETLGEYPVFDLNGEIPFVLSENGLMSSKRSKIDDQDEEIMAIIFSSGTTSRMKGICIPYQTVMESIKMYRHLTGVKQGDKYLYVLPFNHIAGYSGALQHLVMGCELDMIENMDSVKLTRGFQIFQPHYFAMVPKVYEIIAEKILGEVRIQGKEKAFHIMLSCSRFLRKRLHINIGKILFRSVRNQTFGKCMKGIGAGASMCKKETADFFLALGYDWANFYSSTETGVPAVATGVHDCYPDDTVGNIKQFQEITVRLINQDKDGIGEITIKTPLKMKGYFRNEKLTKEVIDDEGYILTGDLGWINAKGYLQVVGRAKEVIILHNGKKISPYDIEEMYESQLGEPAEIVCCGVQNQRDGYDEIHIFVEQTKKVKQTIQTIKSISNKMPTIYKVEQVHVVSNFPKTAIGKIKRQELAKCVKGDEKARTLVSPEGLMAQDEIKELLCRLSGYATIEDTSWTLQGDLQLDSLNLFELAVEIEKKYGIDISNQFAAIKTVGDIIKTEESGVGDEQRTDVDYNINDFPIKRSKKDYIRLHQWVRWMRCIYNIEVYGMENIPKNNSFIMASNHASYFDPLWILTALYRERGIDNVICLAAKHTMEGVINKAFFRMIGGIPVNREGNTVPVLLRTEECMNDQKMLIIFPEGARSRDGSMLPFKEGCAQIAWKCKKSIVPISIKGGYEIFPRWRKLPRVFNYKKMQRYCLKVTFCKPIEPSSDYEAVTNKLRKSIKNCNK